MSVTLSLNWFCLPRTTLKNPKRATQSVLPRRDTEIAEFLYTAEDTELTARPWAGTKKNKETTENTEHAEKQIDFFREFRAFRSCQKLIVVERLSGNVLQLFAVGSTEILIEQEDLKAVAEALRLAQSQDAVLRTGLLHTPGRPAPVIGRA